MPTNVTETRRDIERALAKYYVAKTTLDEVKAEMEAAKEELLKLMPVVKITSTEVDVSGTLVKGTIVAGTRAVIDEESLKRALGADWDKVTRRMLDKELLEAHVKTGDIPATTVADCTEIKPNAPYIKITTKIGTRRPESARGKRKPSASAPRNRKG